VRRCLHTTEIHTPAGTHRVLDTESDITGDMNQMWISERPDTCTHINTLSSGMSHAGTDDPCSCYHLRRSGCRQRHGQERRLYLVCMCVDVSLSVQKCQSRHAASLVVPVHPYDHVACRDQQGLLRH
jgi:hypothetical protein